MNKKIFALIFISFGSLEWPQLEFIQYKKLPIFLFKGI
jgi:hypothetical protein